MENILLIGALITAAAWGVYLIPNISGGWRKPPLHRPNSSMVDPCHGGRSEPQLFGDAGVAPPVVRRRRRRTLGALTLLAIGTLAGALAFSSIGWLIGHLALDAVIAWYVGMLMQVKQREAERVAQGHIQSLATTADEPPVRIVAGAE